jgi:AmmeMemoRadiSam system protein B
MSIRPRSLPAGWYPAGEAQTRRQIEAFLREVAGPDQKACAGVVPHAGWEFSGRLACRLFACLDPEIQTVAVVGGHLSPGGGVLAAFEEAYETPLGAVPADLELLACLRERIQVSEDRWEDNTVEVQLPLLRHLAPRARALALRAAPSGEALALGEALDACATRLGRKLAVVGSTDLTHYGPNYGFAPHGTGPGALTWVREQNDRRLVEALLALQFERVLELARREHSACSAGGAVAAARFASLVGSVRGSLLEYATSHDRYPGSSFVGYAAISFPVGA